MKKRYKNVRGETFKCSRCGKTYTPKRIIVGGQRVCPDCRGEYRTGSVPRPWWELKQFKRPDGYMAVQGIDPITRVRRQTVVHRLIMEEAIGRLLLRTEWVHHRNGIRDDNRLENLEIVSHTNHRGDVTCPNCQTTFAVH